MKGIVIKINSDIYKVDTPNGINNYRAKGVFKFKKTNIVVGDNVEINDDIIDKVYPRKNEFVRPPIANIDQLIIVISTTNPKPDLELLDKQLIMAEKKDVMPIICINKIDLKDDYDEIIKIYEKIGYQVITTDAKNGIGIDKLAVLLQNKITAFTGNSGVGKSTLTNDIFGEDISEEGETSEKLERGKHTTKFVELFKIATQSYIADTPGFSTYEMSDISCNELDKYFVEFSPFISKCEFRGCSHIKEKKCGVQKAVEDRKIDQGRYDRYCKFYQILKDNKKR
ncbi:MAG: ribosome small subunit-dependent GTPase A [Clostridia bacterium]|nr:ribosome small subunit-dependent GTPase A [Clostridia bacterium]